MHFINNFKTQLTAGVSHSSMDPLPISPASAQMLFDYTEYRLTLSSEDGESVEIIHCTKQGVIKRGAEGTTAQAWPSGTTVYLSMTASSANSIFKPVSVGYSWRDTLPLAESTSRKLAASGSNVILVKGHAASSGSIAVSDNGGRNFREYEFDDVVTWSVPKPDNYSIAGIDMKAGFAAMLLDADGDAYIATSSNNGRSFSVVSKATEGSWSQEIAVTSAGIVVIKNGADIILSSDFGVTFSKITEPSVANAEWFDINSSETGAIALLGDTSIAISNDGGISFSVVSSEIDTTQGFAASTYLMIAGSLDADTVTVSRNNGASWASQTVVGGVWEYVLINQDASLAVLLSKTERMLAVSTDQGYTFTVSPVAHLQHVRLYSAALSDDGITACGEFQPEGEGGSITAFRMELYAQDGYMPGSVLASILARLSALESAP